MPIRPENKKRYPDNWKEIREKILKRANNQCEFIHCKVSNGAVGVRLNGEFVELFGGQKAGEMWSMSESKSLKVIKIVLTIAHLDHQPENNDENNLKALCQQCHNRYDAKFRAENRKRNKNVSTILK